MTHPDPAIRALSAAILCQATADTHRGMRRDRNESPRRTDRRVADCAAFWASEWCQELCEAAGVDADRIRRMIAAGDYDRRAVERGKSNLGRAAA